MRLLMISRNHLFDLQSSFGSMVCKRCPSWKKCPSILPRIDLYWTQWTDIPCATACTHYCLRWTPWCCIEGRSCTIPYIHPWLERSCGQSRASRIHIHSNRWTWNQSKIYDLPTDIQDISSLLTWHPCLHEDEARDCISTLQVLVTLSSWEL